MKTSLFLGGLFTAIALPAFAEQLSGQDVARLLGSGDLQFEAGSVARFSSNGTYVFQHTNGQQSGTYSVYSNGMVTFVDGGTEHSFVVDQKNNGRLEVQYVAGPWRGDAYMLR